MNIKANGMMAMLMLVAAPVALADNVQVLERDLELSGATKLRVSNVAGEVEVETWDQPGVWFHAELGEDCTGVDTPLNGGTLAIDVKVKPKVRGDKSRAILRVKAPAGCDVSVATVSADVRVNRPQGILDVETTSGEINAQFVGARATYSSVSGSIRTSTEADQVDIRTASGEVKGLYNAGNLRVETVSGDIRIEGEQGRVSISTTSGELSHLGTAAQIDAGSVSGDIRVANATGTVELFSTSGDVTVNGTGLSELRAESISGDIRFGGSINEACVLEVSSKSGDVNLSIPASTPARYDLRSFSGDIGGGMAGEHREDAKSVEFANPGATAQVTAKTFSGDIRLDALDD